MRIGNQKKGRLSPINDVKKRAVFPGKGDKKIRREPSGSGIRYSFYSIEQRVDKRGFFSAHRFR